MADADSNPTPSTTTPIPPSPRPVQELRDRYSSGSASTPPPSLSMPSIISPMPQQLPSYLLDHDLPPSPTESSTSTGKRDWLPPSIVSPAFTPITTPGTPNLTGIPVEPSEVPSRLLKELPEVSCIVRARIPTTTGTEIFLHLYQNSIDNKEHLAIVFGDRIRSKSLDAPRPGETEMDRMIRGAYTGRLHPGRTTSCLHDDENSSAAPQPAAGPPLVRIHSECYTGETAWSARCDCGEQLDEAARLMSLDPVGGCVVYLRQEGRGIGLGEKLKAYNLQDLGNDTVQANLLLRHPADARSYGLATAILQDLGLASIRLLTNNPEKIAAVEGPRKEVKVVERVPMIPLAWKNMKGGVTGKEVSEYLKTKIMYMGHMLPMPPEHQQ